MTAIMMEWNQLLSTMRPEAEAPEVFDKGESRSSFERDYDRVVFSFDFRRMQGKTQVLPFAESDFVHDRLTHSLETSSIGRSLGKLVGNRLKQQDKLGNYESIDIATIVSTACLAHDIGNPPFGHRGEEAIKAFFNFDGNDSYFKDEISKENILSDHQIKDLKSFDGNPQGLRIIINKQRGLGLTYATIGSFIKYPWESLKLNGIDKFGLFLSEKESFINVANILGLVQKSESPLEYCRHPLSFLVEAADDIAYRIIDLEDTIILEYTYFHEKITDILSLEEMQSLNKISRIEDFRDITVEDLLKRIAGTNFNDRKYSNCKNTKSKYAYLRAMIIGSIIEEITEEFFNHYGAIMDGNYGTSLLKTIKRNDEMRIVQEITRKREYKNQAALQIELSGHEVLGKLLKMILDAYIYPDPKNSYKRLVQDLCKINEKDRYKLIMEIIDFISGMTDSFALSFFQK